MLAAIGAHRSAESRLNIRTGQALARLMKDGEVIAVLRLGLPYIQHRRCLVGMPGADR